MENIVSQQSLGTLTKLFAALPPPEENSLHCVYRAQFVGPTWLRKIAPPGLGLLGLGGWWGKEFFSDGSAENIVTRNGAFARVLKMTLHHSPSLIDGKPCAALRYESNAPLPWRWVVDELRCVDNRTLLGISIVDLPLPKMPLPFLLIADKQSEK